IVAAALRPGFRLEQGNAFAQRFRRGELIEDEIVPALRGALDGGGTTPGRPQRRMRRLLRRRLDKDVLEAPKAAGVREALACRPRLEENLKPLVETRLRLLGRDTEPFEFGMPVAFADPEIESSTGEEIEHRGLLGE